MLQIVPHTAKLEAEKYFLFLSSFFSSSEFAASLVPRMCALIDDDDKRIALLAAAEGNSKGRLPEMDGAASADTDLQAGITA